jgi:hypothetical protein
MEVYIGNLRKGITVREIKEMFSHMGEIVEAEIIRAHHSDPFGKDFAILRLVQAETVGNAIVPGVVINHHQ